MTEKTTLNQLLQSHFGTDLSTENIQSVAGGCINNTLKATTNKGTFFVKLNHLETGDLFEKEAKGLKLLKKHSSLGIPEVLAEGQTDQNSYLVLEWIEKGHQDANFWEVFGTGLAAQHQNTADFFGLDHNNHIGRLPQYNNHHTSWSEFFVEERLKPQIQLASNSALLDQSLQRRFENLFSQLESLVPREKPSFLQGDLWSGNFMCGPGSKPYIFDPAVYYGHRETELAFTRMFGGFDRQFYHHYHETFPLDPGFEDRIEIHNLYPLLVHVNLFGSSYLSGIISTLKRFT